MKYGSKKVELDGYMFDSKGEANRWLELKLMQKYGSITDLDRQRKIELIPNQYDETGRVVERAVSIVPDFTYLENGKRVFEDFKSTPTMTREFIIKRKLLRFMKGAELRISQRQGAAQRRTKSSASEGALRTRRSAQRPAQLGTGTNALSIGTARVSADTGRRSG